MALLRNLSLTLLLVLASSGCSTLSYVWQAGKGQFALYNRERPIAEAAQDLRVSERIRKLLLEVPQIKSDVEEALGVQATSNYSTFVDIGRPNAIWVLSSAAPFELKLKSWSFPIVGSFPYLGFFSEEMAREWGSEERQSGQDVYMRGATAYSMLGYLREPLLSSMLRGRKQDLVNLIFHETLHSHVYLDGNGGFNEQIASYFGDYGELQYLEQHFGKESQEVRQWRLDREDRRKMGAVLRAFERELKETYQSSAQLSEKEKQTKKASAFSSFKKRVLSESWHSERWGKWLSEKITNNASLLAHLTYEDQQEIYELLHEKSAGDLKESLRLVKEFVNQYFKRDLDISPQRQLEAFLKQPATVSAKR